MLPVSKLILIGMDSDTILEAPASEDGIVLITADRTGYSEAIAVVTNANYDAGMSVTVEFSDYPLTLSKPLCLSPVKTSNASKRTYTLNGVRVKHGVQAASGVYYSEEFKRADLRMTPLLGKENLFTK